MPDQRGPGRDCAAGGRGELLTAIGPGRARYRSGETDIQGRVSRCGDELARTALCEAAHFRPE